jgi:uncharacterized protein (AIM24 family)
MFVAALGGSRTVSLYGSDVYGVGVQHIVSFDASLNYTLTSVGNISANLLGGEGKICKFNGEGEIVMQTSSRDGLYAYLGVDDDEGSDASKLSSMLDR